MNVSDIFTPIYIWLYSKEPVKGSFIKRRDGVIVLGSLRIVFTRSTLELALGSSFSLERKLYCSQVYELRFEFNLVVPENIKFILFTVPEISSSVPYTIYIK